MKRREFITLLGSMAVAWPFAALAQRKSKSYRIGYLALLPGERTTLAKVFLQRLHELGYSEDKNIVFEYRSAEGQADRVPALAAELVRADPDVLVAGFGTVAAKAALAATKRIPIVFTGVGDPVGAGLVANLSHPGGNITGMSAQAAELSAKRLQLLNDLVPGKKLLAVSPIPRWRSRKSGQPPGRTSNHSPFSKQELPTSCPALSTPWSGLAPPVC
jgi:putative ABC transport system substrate-binding protein